MIEGYVVSHPWRHGEPPPLNALLRQLPADADTYYLHDLALIDGARGRGAAAAIVARVAAHARAQGFATVSLTAIGAAPAFWQRHGFVPGPASPAYGDTAIAMTRPIWGKVRRTGRREIDRVLRERRMPK